VSRTRAITAAHCVPASDVRDPTVTQVLVQLIDVDREASASRRDAEKLTGTFPAFEHSAIAAGYRVTELACRVHARCGSGFDPFECPTEVDADIALLECEGGLPSDREPVPIAADDDEHGPVTMFWFHEIYDAPFERPTSDDAQALDLFEHYTAYGRMESNFHYFGDQRNQLLPLVSVDWRDAGPRRRLGREHTTVKTDLFGCHGSSGSGIMQRNAATGRYELLGPTAQGITWPSTHLCVDLAAHRPGTASITYTATEYTRVVAAIP
jgi:hypothetical protein